VGSRDGGQFHQLTLKEIIMDLSSITGAVDLAAVGAGILAIGALKVVPEVVRYGAKKVIGFIRG
jgi:hypothetical protein